MKEEVFNKIKSVIGSKCKMELSDEYKPILEKHDAFNTNITLSDKLTSVSDPYERFIVSVYIVDNIPFMIDSKSDEIVKLRENHEDLFALTRFVITGKADKAKTHFDKYITQF